MSNFFQRSGTGRMYQNPSTVQNSDFDITATNIPVAVRNDPTYGTYRKYADGTTQGRYIISGTLRSAAIALTTNTAVDVGSILLPLGKWKLFIAVGATPAATTSITRLQAAISKTSATLPAVDTSAFPTDGEVIYMVGQAAGVPGLDIDSTKEGDGGIVEVTTPTRYYGIVRARFTVSTLGGYGAIWAESVV